MSHRYDAIVPHLVAALKAAHAAGIEARLLGKGGLQSLMVAHFLGHELSPGGQGYDAADNQGMKYEYKATNPERPQGTFIFSKHGEISDAIEHKTQDLDGVVLAIIGPDGVERCHLAPIADFVAFTKSHFKRVAHEVEAGVPRRGRPRADSTAETRQLCLSEEIFKSIPNMSTVKRTDTR